MSRILKKILLGILTIIAFFAGYLFVGSAKPAKDITWGVNFSQKHAKNLGLDWRKTYLALLEDLGVRNFKLTTTWDLLEKEKGLYDFEDLDWQVAKARDYGAKMFLVIGMKTPRWPECHIPEWAKGLDESEQQERVLRLLKNIVLRYRDYDNIWAWQVENEPFFSFGECPRLDKDFLKKEIDLVKSLDNQNRPVIITESGEFSLWTRAARYGDMVGVTMYEKVWFHQISKYVTYPFPPVFYSRKAQIIRKIFGKEVIGVELQAEPWTHRFVSETPLGEQEETMNLERFRGNIEFAAKTNLSQHYLWGAEWWYWMKEKQNKPEMWDEARKLFQ